MVFSIPLYNPALNNWSLTLHELIAGGVIFLTLVSIYDALFGIWEYMFGESERREFVKGNNNSSLSSRITFAAFTVVLAYLILSFLHHNFSLGNRLIDQ